MTLLELTEVSEDSKVSLDISSSSPLNIRDVTFNSIQLKSYCTHKRRLSPAALREYFSFIRGRKSRKKITCEGRLEVGAGPSGGHKLNPVTR